MGNRIQFGVKAKDKITGFEGIVTGFARYITGCDQYYIVPRVDEKGAKQDGQWFDDNRLDVVDAIAIVLEPVAEAKPLRAVGCDTPAPHCN